MAKIVLYKGGVRDLLRSDEMQAVLQEHGEAIMGRLPEGYEMDDFVGKNRRNVQIKAESLDAIDDNMKNNTLLKAVKSQ